jgi:hypothetical protein
MKKIILIPILIVYAIAIAVVAIVCRPGVKEVTYEQSFPQITQQTVVQSPAVRSVSDAVMFYPTTIGGTYSSTIGMSWYDEVNEDLRFIDGNYPTGIKFVFGKYADDVITINTSQDTVEFPPLMGDYAFDVVFKLLCDTINADSVTINFQHTYDIDSTWVGVNDSFFPYTLSQGASDINFIVGSVYKHQLAIINWSGATVGTASIPREINQLP